MPFILVKAWTTAPEVYGVERWDGITPTVDWVAVEADATHYGLERDARRMLNWCGPAFVKRVGDDEGGES